MLREPHVLAYGRIIKTHASLRRQTMALKWSIVEMSEPNRKAAVTHARK